MEPAAVAGIVSSHRIAVLVGVGCGHPWSYVKNDAHLCFWRNAAGRLHRQAVAQEQVVRCGERRLRILNPRRHTAVQIPEPRRAERLVQCRPVRDAITKCAEHDAGVLSKGKSGVACGPAAAVLQLLWQVPVIERGEGLNARFK